jgi:hypothetical protein
VDSRLRRSPPDRASAVPYGQAGENAMRFPRLAHRSAAAHKLHSTPQQHRTNLISGNGETTSRLLDFSLFLPGTCPNNRDRRTEQLANDTLEARLGGIYTLERISKESDDDYWPVISGIDARRAPEIIAAAGRVERTPLRACTRRATPTLHKAIG